MPPAAPGPRRRPADVATAALLAATALLTFWQILARHLGPYLPLPAPLVNVSYTEELGRYLFVWAMLIGTVAAVGRREHLRLELVGSRMGPQGARVLHALRVLAWGILCTLLSIGGVRIVVLQWRTGQASAALGWPIVWVTVAIPVCAVLLIVSVARHRQGEKP